MDYEHYLKNPTEEMLGIVQTAKEVAAKGAYRNVGTQHLLVALATAPSNAKSILESLNVTPFSAAAFTPEVSPNKQLKPAVVGISDEARTAFIRAFAHLHKWQHPLLKGVHLLSAILECPSDDYAKRLLNLLDVDEDSLQLKVNICLKLLPTEPKIRKMDELELIKAAPSAEKESSMERTKTDVAPARKQFTDWFTDEARDLFSIAQQLSAKSNSPTIRLQDLLAALIEEKNSNTRQILACFVDPDGLLEEICSSQTESPSKSSSLLSSHASAVLTYASSQSRRLGFAKIRSEDILSGVLSVLRENRSSELLQAADFDLLLDSLIHSASKSARTSPSVSETIHHQTKIRAITARAHRALLKAKYEAKLLGHEAVTTHHLLIGLIAEAQVSEVDFVNNRKFDLAKMRTQLGGLAGTRVNIHADADPSFSEDSKAILALAAAEAQSLHASLIDLNHIAIGIIRNDAVQLGQIFEEYGLEVRSLERRLKNCWLHQVHRGGPVTEFGGLIDISDPDQQIKLFLDELEEKELAKSGYLKKLSARSQEVMHFAQAEARLVNAHEISLEHLFFGILSDESIKAAKLIATNAARSRSQSQLKKSKRKYPAKNLGAFVHHVLVNAEKQSEAFSSEHIEPEHILLSMCDEVSSRFTFQMLYKLDIHPQRLRKQLLEWLADK